MEKKTFIEEKSLEVFSRINNKNLEKEHFSLKITPLNGISNRIFHVKLVPIYDNDTVHKKNFFFKIFGKISSLVDRNVETIINNSLAKFGYSPQIYDTDNVTYRIEEYLDGYDTLSHDVLYHDHVINYVIKILAYYNTIMDVNTYARAMSNYDKKEYFNNLSVNSQRLNVIFYMKDHFKSKAEESFHKFKYQVINDIENVKVEYEENLNKIEVILNTFEERLYEICPNKAILVLSHNDSHSLNILSNKDYSKMQLIDHEYAFFNFLGYDIINYFIESMFCLKKDKFPYYKIITKEFSILKDDSFFKIYQKFLNYFRDSYRVLFTGYKNFDEIFEYTSTKEYYIRLIGVNCLFILLYSCIYFDYEKIKRKTSYDYFSYTIDRIKGYDFANNFINN